MKKKFTELNVKIDSWHNLMSQVDSKNIGFMRKSDHEFILGWEASDSIKQEFNRYDPHALDQFLKKNQNNYVFGFLSYDIKESQTRHLIHKDKTTFPNLEFFAAQNVIIKHKSGLLFYGFDADLKKLNISNEFQGDLEESNFSSHLTCSVNQADYEQNVQELKNQIQLGNFYEMNYCMEYVGKIPNVDSKKIFKKIVDITDAPFSTYYASPDVEILSGSPERYIKKKEKTLSSQPIKGTAKRGSSETEDLKIAKDLKNDEKERSENIMIVDLVRNDLSKIATKNSVNVTELCKLYSFNTVHQLISRVCCQISDNITFSDVIDATFPMGSMTGAPKINAIKFAHQFEKFNRGIYAGSVGVIEPNGNFDFNVVIRSIILNKLNNSMHIGIGGAITIKSDPSKEFEECNVKFKAIREVLNA